MSTALSCPFYNMISGATYSGVPTNDLVDYPSSNTLDIPKSARQAFPFSSNKMFSGFISLYMMFYECK